MQTVPVPAEFNTYEFRQSDGPSQHNAAAAWQAGYTGSGVTIAVVDSGIDADNPEFAGRLAPGSRDIYGQRPLESPDDHGTRVALVAAGGRDGTGILGMAWGANILALRTDRPGSCDAHGSDGECSFTDSAVADAVTHATNNGAKVINISLGGGSAGTVLTDAVRDAVENGVLVVIAAGNDALAQPTNFTSRLSAAGAGGVLVVGAVDENNAIADFSNRPGSQSANHLVARGKLVCCVYEDGEVFVDDEGFLRGFSGTSFAAPQVSGAAALLAQAFPHLTGRELAAILLESAFDAGDAGPDAVFGRGVLDVAAAFRPLGPTTLAGEEATLALGDDIGTASPAMGDALARIALPTLVTDRYDRAFGVDLATGLRGAAQDRRLTGALTSQQRNVVLASDKASLAFSIDASGADRTGLHIGTLELSHDQARQARVLAARIALKLAPQTQFGFAYRTSADGIVAQLRGAARPAFMIANDASASEGAVRRSDLAFGLRQKLGAWGVTLSAQSGETLGATTIRRAALLRGESIGEAALEFGIAFDRRFGTIDTALGLNWVAEERTVLGARLHDAFGLEGADTLFLDGELGWGFARKWRLGAGFRLGTTSARQGGLVASGSRLTSNAFSLDLAHTGVLQQDDAIAFRLAQPLRVTGGALALSLPRTFDYATLTATRETQRLSLAPEGREIVGEVSWTGSLLSGNAAASLFYRRDPGHYAARPDDAGVALRWSRGF